MPEDETELRAAQELARRVAGPEQFDELDAEHEALRRYMKIIIRIYARLKSDPEQWRRARTLIEKRKQEKKDRSEQLELF